MVTDSVPLLNKLPLIGRLFRTVRHERIRGQDLLLATVRPEERSCQKNLKALALRLDSLTLPGVLLHRKAGTLKLFVTVVCCFGISPQHGAFC